MQRLISSAARYIYTVRVLRVLLGFCGRLFLGVRRDTVLLCDGRQLLQELGVKDDGEHSTLSLRGDGRAGRQDAERGQSQGVLHRAVRTRRVQDDVATLRLEALLRKVIIKMSDVLICTFSKDRRPYVKYL